LQISILYLQRLDLNRRIAKQSDEPVSALADDYFLTTRFIAVGLNWTSWLLSAYVGHQFSFASASSRINNRGWSLCAPQAAFARIGC
jgi:hypothetical protein